MARFAFFVELDWRDGEPFLPYILGRGGGAGGDICTDVHLMAPSEAPEKVFPAVKDRTGSDYVAYVSVAAVRVIAGDYVALMNVALEGAHDLLEHHLHRIGVDWQRISDTDLPGL